MQNEFDINSANVNKVDEMGFKPLHWAVVDGNEKEVEELIKKGAEIDCFSFTHYTPLHLAIIGNYENIINLLKAQKADINIKDGTGMTILHRMCFNNDIQGVKKFLNAGIDINIKISSNGMNALHCAILENNVDIIKELLKAGIDISAKNNEGKTSLDVAKEKNIKEVIKLINEVELDKKKKNKLDCNKKSRDKFAKFKTQEQDYFFCYGRRNSKPLCQQNIF